MRFPPLRYHIFFFMIALFLLALAIIFLVIIPSAYQILDLRNSINATHTFIENQYKKTKPLRRSVHNFGDVAKIAKKFNQATIQKGNELSVITNFERLATEHQLKQTLKVSYTGVPDGIGYLNPVLNNPNQFGFYTFSFVLEGTYPALLGYLHDAELMPFYLVIDSLRWDRTDASQSISLRFQGRIFTAPTPPL